MNYDDKVLHHIWDVELEIMDEIHRICVKYGIKYSLGFGSLIGAVRHKGFIPWDDDIDLVMPRNDYERLKHIWNAEADKRFVLQDKCEGSNYTQNFYKIRKDHTAFIQGQEDVEGNYHKGIFVDVCPCDRVPDGRMLRNLQFFACAVNLLLAREHTSGTGGLTGIVEKVILALPHRWRPRIREEAKKIMTHWNGQDDLRCIFPDTIQNCKRYCPADTFDRVELTEFQGRMYYAIAHPERWLTIRYGDYMQLPAPEERVWKHHPLLVDFERNYEEIPKEERI